LLVHKIWIYRVKKSLPHQTINIVHSQFCIFPNLISHTFSYDFHQTNTVKLKSFKTHLNSIFQHLFQFHLFRSSNENSHKIKFKPFFKTQFHTIISQTKSWNNPNVQHKKTNLPQKKKRNTFQMHDISIKIFKLCYVSHKNLQKSHIPVSQDWVLVDFSLHSALEKVFFNLTFWNTFSLAFPVVDFTRFFF
jgi:hypothetical protein